MIRRSNGFLVMCFLCFNAYLTFAQTISGRLLSNTIGGPLSGIALQLKNTEYESFTNGAGNYSFLQIPSGSYELIARSEGVEVSVTKFEYNGQNLDLGTMSIELPVISTGSEISSIDVNDLAGIEGEEDNFSSVLSAGRDPYVNAAAYNLSAGRFRIRGYNNEDSEMLMNGMSMNDQDDGRVLWNAWSGLNDVLRQQTQILTLAANDYTFGGVGGATFVDLRASTKRDGTRISVSNSNRTFQHRLMATHSTGLMENGWAFTGAASYRYGARGYIQGTHFEGASYFLSVDRKINSKHMLNAVVFGAPQVRGRSAASVQESYDLTGSNFYNSFWGYQNGKVRNSREYRINQPVVMLRHDFNIAKNLTLLTNIGYQFGTYASTALDWYEAPTPQPDYYRRLPSFFTDPSAKEAITAQYQNDVNTQQVNWHALYDANAYRDYTLPSTGIAGFVRGKLAAYVIEAQHFDNQKLNGSTLLNYFRGSTQFTAGASYLKEKVHYYKKLDDLLGAEFSVDYNDFALRDFPGNPEAAQNDLNSPDRLLYEGDVFGYNYKINTQRYGGWGQVIQKFSNIDVFLAGSLYHQSFFREGLTKVGLFPNNSFGKSEVATFLNVGAKGGITYKLNGRNYFQANASYTTRAPFANESFISPRTRDQLADNLTSEKILATELSYIFKFTKLKGRISAYRTEFNDKLDNQVFFHDDYITFVNYLMRDIDRVHQGVELGLQYQMNSQWSLVAAGNLGQYFYTSRPLATIARDNSSELLATDRVVYINNYFLPTVQEAATVGINHRNKRFWFANLNVNYFGKNYLNINPDRRTRPAVEGVSDATNYDKIIDQELLPSAITVDLFAGKTWRLKNRAIIGFNLSVSNILDKTDFKSSGFEQLRFDFDTKNVDRFPPRYFYAFGRNYNLNITYTFN